MILIPFGFTASSGGAVPTNSVAPLVVIVDPDTGELTYVAGTWNNADSVSFAWFMNNVEQVGEVGTTFFANFDLDVKVIETATNVNGSATQDSNIVNIPAPPQYETGSATWSFDGASLDSLGSTVETGSAEWTYSGGMQDSYITPVDQGEIYWEVFGSVV